MTFAPKLKYPAARSVPLRAWNWPRLIEISGLVLILLLAAYLRLINIADNPGWYSDEGTEVDIAAHWLNGETQYLAINQSTLIAARPPIFPMVLSGMFRLNGVSITSLRWLTGLLGVLSVVLLYGYVRVSRQHDRWLALLAALLLAIYPAAIIYSRIGFMYNLLTPLMLLMAIGLWQYLEDGRRRGLALAAVSIGLGAAAVLSMLTLVLPFVIIVTARRWRDLLWSLPLLAAPLTVYALAMLITTPSAFVFDLQFTLTRLNTIPLLMQPLAIATNMATVLSRDAWIVAAFIGLFLLRPRRWQWFNLLLWLLPLIMLGRTSWLLGGQGFYYLIPWLPWIALGVAGLVHDGAPWVRRTTHAGMSALFERWAWRPAQPIGLWLQTAVLQLCAAAIVIMLIVAPLIMSTGFVLTQTQSGLPTGMDELLVNPADARLVIDFVNHEARPDDVVIASPTLAWAITARAADFQQAAAADRAVTLHFPIDIPADRFAFDPRYANAAFVVIDPVWRNWAADRIPYVAAMMQQVQQWPLVFRAGDIEVYRNPQR